MTYNKKRMLSYGVILISVLLAYFCRLVRPKNTFARNFDHHNIIAIISPIIVPSTKPTIVSYAVTFMCVSKLFEDKFIKVFNILLGWLVIKLSIILLLAKASQIAKNPTKTIIWVNSTNTLFFFIFFIFFSFRW